MCAYCRNRQTYGLLTAIIVTEVCPESATAVPQGLPEVISVVTFKLSFYQVQNGGKGILGQSFKNL